MSQVSPLPQPRRRKIQKSLDLVGSVTQAVVGSGAKTPRGRKDRLSWILWQRTVGRGGHWTTSFHS